MRLHRLRIKAFGPFADDVVIDFDELGADGLFLLHGQTGAGKTTVLDAVAFALYGRVPGARDTTRRLRSDHAAPDQAPEVELEATIGSRRLRITRTPEYERPKKRGEGMRKINATASLAWLDDSGPDLTRIPDVGEAVVRLLGMSADQFFQVVLLPQGDFARFLRAHPDEREALLEKLFDTERFGDIEDWLRDRARESATRLAEHAAAVERVAGQIVAISGVPAPAEADFEWAQGCLDAAHEAAERTGAELAAAQAAAEQAEAAHRDALRAEDLRRRGAQARDRLAQLDEGAETLAEADRARRLALRAAPIAHLADDHDRLTAEVAEKTVAADRAREALAELAEGRPLCESDCDDATLVAAVDRWAEESGRWEPLARRVAERPRTVADIDELEEAIAAAEREAAGIGELLDAAPARREEAVTALREAEELRAQAPRLRAERDATRRTLQAFDDRDQVLDQLAKAERDLLDAREKHTAAREHQLELRERRLAGMASELARGLVDGEPCIVCGSPDHPAPAASDEEQIGESDEKRAAADEQAASAIRSIAESEVIALKERRANLDAVIGDADRVATKAELDRLAADLAAAERAAARTPTLREAVERIDAEIAGRRSALADLDSAQSARRERLSGLRESLSALDAEVAEATGGRIGVDERRRELAELCARARRLREARRDAEQARRRLDEVADRLATACAEAGFATVEDVRAALVPPAQIQAWERMLEDAATLRAASEETLADPEVREALEAPAVDVERLAADWPPPVHIVTRRRSATPWRCNAVPTSIGTSPTSGTSSTPWRRSKSVTPNSRVSPTSSADAGRTRVGCRCAPTCSPRVSTRCSLPRRVGCVRCPRGVTNSSTPTQRPSAGDAGGWDRGPRRVHRRRASHLDALRRGDLLRLVGAGPRSRRRGVGGIGRTRPGHDLHRRGFRHSRSGGARPRHGRARRPPLGWPRGRRRQPRRRAARPDTVAITRRPA